MRQLGWKLLIIAAFSIAITACNKTDVAIPPVPETLEIAEFEDLHEIAASEPETPAITPDPEPPEEPEKSPYDMWDLSAIELLGYYIDENNLYIDKENLVELEYFDLFREYFFGTWDGWKDDLPLILDDSEKINIGLGWNEGPYLVGENVLVFFNGGTAEQTAFWIDMRTPDTMYFDTVYGTSLFARPQPNKTYTTKFLTKTDAPINQPENGFISRLREREFARDYIDITFWEYEREGLYRTAHREDFWTYSPMYLISQTDDEFVFKTKLSDLHVFDPQFEPFDVVITVERVDGEWVRRIEVA
ncbi:MAG: hypothetical protein FWH20_04435 [Oscillospiraceae bacterium]|nr:hypothetical protein [Oscillospiraceae bacterium]